MGSIARIRRLLLLLDTLQTGRIYNTQQLADLSQVSRRTMFRDIRTLQESGLHILYDEQRQGYQLVGNRFMAPTDLTLEEALSLIIVCENLGRSNSGLPFTEPARSAVLKLHNTLPPKLRAYVTSLVDGTAIKIDAITDLTKVRTQFITIRDAMGENSSVRIQYQSYAEQKVITTLLSTYRLMFSRHSWYAIGRSSVHRDIRTFNISRVLEAEVVPGKTYEIPPRFSIERYLGNAWQMIRQKPYDIPVKIHFSPLVARNVAEVNWHKTQKLKFLDNGSLEYQVTVDGLDEISWWIMGYGAEASVIEPPELKQKMTEHAKRMFQQYAG
jgi:predicted DNA-binding transcriptional regulator YafY